MLTLIRLDLDDYTYNVPSALLWSLLECQLAILVANIPFIRPVLVPCCSRLASTVTGGRSNRSGLHGSAQGHSGGAVDEEGLAFGGRIEVWGGVRKGARETQRAGDGDSEESVMEYGRRNEEVFGLRALDCRRLGKKETGAVVVGGQELEFRSADAESVGSQVTIAQRGAAPGMGY